MSAAYFNAAIPEPFRILGLTLKPLSLGRYRLLKRFDVAFVADEATKGGVSDLILGLLICSMRVDEFVTWANSKSFARDVRRWSRSLCRFPILGFLPWYGKRWREKHSFNIVEKMGLFGAYISQHTKVPSYWDETQSDTTSAAHWSQSLDVLLRSELGWTNEEINEEPLSKALSDGFKLAENKGQVRLMTDQELQMIAELEKANNGA